MTTVPEHEQMWARQISEVVGAQNAALIIDLARVNGLFDTNKEAAHMRGFVDFVNLWCSRGNVTDAERVSVIKHHPVAQDRLATMAVSHTPEPHLSRQRRAAALTAGKLGTS